MLKIRIAKHELGLSFRHGELNRVLEPGTYFAPGRAFGVDRVEVVSTLTTRFAHKQLEALALDKRLEGLLRVVDLKDHERGLVWGDGRLACILGPGSAAFWEQPRELEVEVVDVSTPRFEHSRMRSVLAHRDASKFLRAVVLDPLEAALFFQEGELIDSVVGGMHVFWKLVPEVVSQTVDLREQTVDVQGQEVMTADKVSVRLNLAVSYRVTDPVTAVTSVDDFGQALYREAQLALRTSVGGRSLDRLLSDKEAVGEEIRANLAERMSGFGLEVASAGLRDVILPGDMKVILNQVIEAQKRAEANLIRRREETAAARSQANTARLLADNPALARMKELEAVQDILRGTKATFLFGQGDLAEQVKTLVAQEPQGEDDSP